MSYLKEKLSLLPEEPGCYLMKDKDGTIIYVGKAKVLKNRVKSYFTGSHNAKTQKLVSEIVDFETIVTRSNTEALLLEVNLIKKHLPKYNILLKDDKNYPYLKLTKEKHPRLLLTRKVAKDGAKYFGPYPNTQAANEVKKLLDRIYPLRKCEVLPKKTCLYYHLGQCLAPCIQDVKDEEQIVVEDVVRFLKGDVKDIQKRLTEKMNNAATALQFEQAKEYRDQLKDIETLMVKQTIDTKDFIDRDIVACYRENGWIAFQVFFMRSGKLIERNRAIYPSYREQEEEMASFLLQLYTNHTKPKEILVEEEFAAEELQEALDLKLKVPKRGEKKALVDLAKKNATLALKEQMSLLEAKENKVQHALEEIKEALEIPLPKRIEAFDNSNIQGSDAVAALVVFTDGKPDKKDYRKYKIKSVKGPDDYASMKEVMTRRYKKAKEEKLPLPDLILVDGGVGQINVAKDVLERLGLSIPVAGLAKNEHHQTNELISGDTMEAVSLKKRSEGFYLLVRIQEEVHRFAITFHRQTRSKRMFGSTLDDMPGIGKKRKQSLLQTFGSLEKIKEASLEALVEAGIPKQVASELLEKLKKESKKDED